MAALVVGVLGAVHDLTIGERLVAQLVPPLSLLLVVSVTRHRRGRERIVFYQVTSTAVLASMICAFVAGLDVMRVADHLVTGIAVFLVFGRVGCFRVACCHGRHARWGVRYDERHVAHGLAARFAGRTLIPVQLLESAASAALALICALQLGRGSGIALTVFTLGYAGVRFVLELFRGDAARPIRLGLSEAQWFAVGSAIAATVVSGSWAAVLVVGPLTIAAGVVAAVRHRPISQLHSPQHVGEIDRALAELLAEGGGSSRTTQIGLKLSLHVLADMRLDVICSHPMLGVEDARRLAEQLFTVAELIPARAANTVHLLIPAPRVHASPR